MDEQKEGCPNKCGKNRRNNCRTLDLQVKMSNRGPENGRSLYLDASLHVTSKTRYNEDCLWQMTSSTTHKGCTRHMDFISVCSCFSSKSAYNSNHSSKTPLFVHLENFSTLGSQKYSKRCLDCRLRMKL